MIWPFIILSYASLFVYGLADNIRGPLFPEILKEFAVSDSVGSAMFAITSISGFISSHFARRLLRRFERKTVLQVSAAALTLSMLGLAGSFHFSVFLVFSFAFGLSLGIVGLIPNILVPLGSTPTRKQQLLAGLHAMYGLASFMAPLLAATVGGLSGSWRWTFAIAAMAPASLVAYTFHSSHRLLHKKVDVPLDPHNTHNLQAILPQLYLALTVSMAVAAEIMVSSRLALYMRRVWDYDLEKSSLFVTGFFACMLISRIFFTVVKFKSSVKRQLSLVLVSSALLILMGLYLHPFGFVLMGLTIAPFYPLAITMISSEFPNDLDGAVSYMMAVDSVMLVIMHLGVGKLTDLIGIQPTFLSGLVFLAGSLLLLNSYGPIFKKNSTP